MTPHAIEFLGVTRSHSPGTRALDALNLIVRPGERLAVLGPSGSGKTTLLRLIAGLDSPQQGSIRIGDREMSRVPPHQRDVAMVFQSQALYPHLRVAENLAFSLKARGIPGPERRARVRSVAEMLGIGHLLRRWPTELSGGERQRVALGRAVARSPAILLLDEPFSSLDGPLRAVLRSELLDLHRRVGSTLVMVTHDQAEALMIGERIAILDGGCLLQCETPERVYDHPSHRRVAALVGNPGMNLIRCELTSQDSTSRVRFDGLDAYLGAGTKMAPLPPDGIYDLGFRPEAARVLESTNRDESSPTGAGDLSIPSVVLDLRHHGAYRMVVLRCGHRSIASLPTVTPIPEAGRTVELRVPLKEIHWFQASTGRRIDAGKT